jgi:hypothetical protein
VTLVQIPGEVNEVGEFAGGCSGSGSGSMILLPFQPPSLGITVDPTGDVVVGGVSTLDFYAYSSSRGWYITKRIQYAAGIYPGLLTTAVNGNIYVPLHQGGIYCPQNSSVQVLPNSVQAPYSITNGVECATGAAGGI